MDRVEEPVTDYGQLDLSREYTWLDYLKWKFQDRVELIRGKVVKMSPAPNTNHQLLAGRLYTAFGTFFHQSPCAWFPAPFDVRLPLKSGLRDSTVVQPDLCVVCDSHKLDAHGCNGAPDLVVEILSPGNSRHDLQLKFRLYEEAGVREYWIVQPEERCVLVYTLEAGVFKGLPPVAEGMQVDSLVLPGLKLSVDELFLNLSAPDARL